MTDTQRGTRRPLPVLTDLNQEYWTSGEHGQLRIQRCLACARLIHPPALLCPDDHSDALAFVTVSGRGLVESWTENLHTWLPDIPAPYYVAYIALDDDPRARILTNLTNIEGAPHVGMRVRVTFESQVADDGDTVYIPLFEPDG